MQYIPGLPVDLMTSKKKKKKKKKVVAEKVLEHRDSLSSDQEQLLVSSLRPQGTYRWTDKKIDRLTDIYIQIYRQSDILIDR